MFVCILILQYTHFFLKLFLLLVGCIQKLGGTMDLNLWHGILDLFLFWQIGQAWMALGQSLPEKYMYVQKQSFITLLVGCQNMMGRGVRYIYIDTRHGEYPGICQNFFLDDFATDEVGHSLHIWHHHRVWVKKMSLRHRAEMFCKWIFFRVLEESTLELQSILLFVLVWSPHLWHLPKNASGSTPGSCLCSAAGAYKNWGCSQLLLVKHLNFRFCRVSW